MIVIHHLGASQSDRVVWLMEELGLPYELKWYNRKADRLAPDEYLALHPAATAPVIQDGDRTLVESAAIVEYICHRYAGGRFTVGPSRPEYYDYLYWMHFNNNLLGLFFGKLALRGNPEGPDAQRVAGLIQRRENGYFRHLEQTLGKTPYLAGAEFTCADIMTMFVLTNLAIGLARKFDDLPNTQAYMKRIAARPAYAKAMAIAGPKATPPG
ncbi:MAG: glutathione S-transferase family protein [Alphaproteobacteria bacterium]|nr:glutathione S-transferase family protein [Alphaproteobacteria bacterium]